MILKILNSPKNYFFILIEILQNKIIILILRMNLSYVLNVYNNILMKWADQIEYLLMFLAIALAAIIYYELKFQNQSRF